MYDTFSSQVHHMKMVMGSHWRSKLPQYVIYFEDQNNPKKYTEVSSMIDAVWWMQNYVPVQPVAQTP